MQIFLKLKILLPTIINELVCIHPLHNLRHAFNIYIYIYVYIYIYFTLQHILKGCKYWQLLINKLLKLKEKANKQDGTALIHFRTYFMFYFIGNCKFLGKSILARQRY